MNREISTILSLNVPIKESLIYYKTWKKEEFQKYKETPSLAEFNDSLGCKKHLPGEH